MKTTNSVYCKMIKALLLVLPILFLSSRISYGAQYPKDWKIQYTTRNLCYVGKAETVVIPKSITTIETFAFYDNESVKTIIVPETVKRVQEYSIYNIPNLKTVIFRGNPKIDPYGITYCPRLKNIAVAKKGTYAYKYAEKWNIPVKVGFGAGFQKSKVYLLKGDTCKQILCNTLEEPVSWKSSKPSVASVNSSGRVKAKKKGKAKITAITRKGKYSYTVVVYKKTVSDRVKQIKKDESIKQKSKFERVKTVHAWIIRNVKYDYSNYLKNRLPKSAYTIKGCLLKKKCVCAGYAAAFKKLMKAYHIPCKIVRGKAGGESHAWNMVKLSGKWYHVDVTWDDPIINGSNKNTEVFYDYFLKSTSYMRSHRHSFKTSKYPKCTSKKYDKKLDF